MFRLPEDIMNELKRKYTDTDVNSFVHDIFDYLLRKTIYDGSCAIREYGTFMAYKVFSTRMNKIVPRFKFKIAASLDKKLKNDEHILNKLELCESSEFKEQNERKVKNKHGYSELRVKTESKLRKKSFNGTQNKLSQAYINSLINDED